MYNILCNKRHFDGLYSLIVHAGALAVRSALLLLPFVRDGRRPIDGINAYFFRAHAEK